MLNILEKKSIGVDISDYSIEVAELKKIGAIVSIDKLGRIVLPAGIVKNGRIINKEELAKYLKSVLAQAEPKAITAKKIIFSFPGNQTFFHIFSRDCAGGKMSVEEKDSIVFEEAWSNIPIAKKEMLVYYQVLQEDKNKIDFLIVAASRNVVTEWQDFFKTNGFEVDVFDIEALANFRSLAIEAKKPVCVIDFGSDATNVYVFAKQKLIFEYTINIGGEDLTAEIAKVLGIELVEAEKMKIESGLSDAESKIFPIVIKNLESISEEIKYALDYFTKAHALSVEKIIFIGGSSQLAGLTDYFQTNLNLPVSLGEAKLLAGKKLEFIGVVGAAHRGLYKDEADEPMIPLTMEDFFAEDDEIENEHSTVVNKKVSDESNFLADNRDQEASKKLRFGKIILTIICVLGLVMLGGAYYYRLQRQEKNKSEIEEAVKKIEEITNYQSVESVATTTTEVKIDKITETASSSVPEIVSGPQIVIGETELGYLNVRAGAGKNFEIIATVKPGETYELIKKEGEWTNIRISADKTGWVSNKYISSKN